MWFFKLRQPAPAGAAALAGPVTLSPPRRARPVLTVVPARPTAPAVLIEKAAISRLQLQAEHEARRDRVIERVLGSGSLQRW